MVRIRLFEEEAGRLMEAGIMPGFLHLYVGQEAVAAAVDDCALRTQFAVQQEVIQCRGVDLQIYIARPTESAFHRHDGQPGCQFDRTGALGAAYGYDPDGIAAVGREVGREGIVDLGARTGRPGATARTAGEPSAVPAIR